MTPHTTPTTRRSRVLGPFRCFTALVFVLATLTASASQNRSGLFRNLVERNGIPEGLDPLSKSQASARSATYKIEEIPGKTLSVSLVNGAGTPVPDRNAPFLAARREFQLRPDGTLETIAFFSETGKALGRHVHSRPLFSPRGGTEVLVEIRSAHTPSRPTLEWSQDTPASCRYGEGRDIAAYRVFWDDNGRETHRLFLNAAHAPQPDPRGVLGYGWVYDESGRIVRKTMLDEHAALRSDRQGIAFVKWKHDKQGNLVAISHHASNGGPVIGHDGWHITQIEVDAAGNPVSESRFDSNREPSHSQEKKSFQEIVEFDSRGNPVEKRVFEWDGEPRQTSQVTRKYDQKGRLVEEVTVSANGEPVEKTLIKRDGRGNPTETVSQKFPDEPVIKLVEFDEAGNSIRESLRNSKGQPQILSGNVSQIATKWNETGDAVELAYLDGEGRPVKGDPGYSKVCIQYDSRGHLTEVAFFGEDGMPIAAAAGYARALSRVDEEGRSLEVSYFDEKGQPALSTNGYAKWTATYNERGHNTGVSYFGTDGRPVAGGEGVHCRFDVDEFGNVLEKTHLDAKGEPMVASSCKASLHVYRFDEFGNTIEEAAYDSKGGPVTHKEHFRVLREFDEFGNTRMEQSFRPDGSSVKEIYGPGGRVESLELGPDGTFSDVSFTYCRVVRHSNGPLGEEFAEYHLPDGRYELRFGNTGSEFFDAKGFLVSKTLMNAQGGERESVHFLRNGLRRTSHFDRRGRLVEQRFTDAAGLTIPGPGGFAVQKWKYAPLQGREILLQTSFYDAAGAAMNGLQGFASQLWTVNEYGLETETTFLDANGEKTPGPEGFATLTSKRLDAWGPVLETAAFDTEGKPVADSCGVWKTVSTLDEKGRPVRIATYGTNGEPATSGGFAIREISYDQNEDWIRETFRDSEGNPAGLGGTCFRIETGLNEDGKPTVTSFFGADGSLVLHPHGYASQRRKYDVESNLLEVAHFDAGNEPVVRADGYHKETIRRDKRGNILERAFYDAGGRPVAIIGGYSKIERVLDQDGRLVEEVFLDTEAQPITPPKHLQERTLQSIAWDSAG